MILRKPRAWLLGRLPRLRRQAGWVRGRTLDQLARLRLGKLVVGADRLEDELVAAAAAPLVGAGLLEAMIGANLEEHGLAQVESGARAALERIDGPGPRGTLYRAALRAFSSSHAPSAIAFGEACLPQVANRATRRALAELHERAGGIERPLELRDSGAATLGGAPDRRLVRLRAQAELLRSGIPLTSKAGRRRFTPMAGRVLYYANQTLPHHSSGYAIRTHWMAQTLRDQGWDVSVYTRLGYPNDRYDFIGAPRVGTAATIDGVPYRFTPDRQRGVATLDIAAYQQASVATLRDHAAQLRPALIHCASNYTGGLAGTEAAKQLGLPSIYEVRGLWHMTRAAEQPEYSGSDHYRLIGKLEAQAAKNADHVFAITEGVKQILLRDGVPAEKISVLPNAVDAAAFVPGPRHRGLELRLQLSGQVTIGYIGAFKDYEGLDYLIEAAALLRRRIAERFCLLLVGDGKAEGDLRALRDRLGLGDQVRFIGRVPHHRIADYYSLMDIMAFPRKGLPVCEVVSPLKPFEAMATEKAVIVSNVQALGEIVAHDQTGLVHRKDDVESLADQLERAIQQPELRRQLARAGREWVSENRRWSQVCDQVGGVYRRLTDSAGQT